MITKNALIKLYKNEMKSYSEIAKQFNCSVQTICNYMKRYNIKARTYSESLKNRKHSWGNKISKSLKGHKLTTETKNKISKANKNKQSWNKGLTKYSHPDKIKYGCSKEKHWNWKGGISSINMIERQSSKYKQWRTSVFKRDNYTCQECKKTNCKLNAHHIKSFSKYKNLRYDINNGITLCEQCHKQIHKRGNKNEENK